LAKFINFNREDSLPVSVFSDASGISGGAIQKSDRSKERHNERAT